MGLAEKHIVCYICIYINSALQRQREVTAQSQMQVSQSQMYVLHFACIGQKGFSSLEILSPPGHGLVATEPVATK